MKRAARASKRARSIAGRSSFPCQRVPLRLASSCSVLPATDPPFRVISASPLLRSNATNPPNRCGPRLAEVAEISSCGQRATLAANSRSGQDTMTSVQLSAASPSVAAAALKRASICSAAPSRSSNRSAFAFQSALAISPISSCRSSTARAGHAASRRVRARPDAIAEMVTEIDPQVRCWPTPGSRHTRAIVRIRFFRMQCCNLCRQPVPIVDGFKSDS